MGEEARRFAQAACEVTQIARHRTPPRQGGRLGACCATIAEAEALAAAGIGGLQITSPLATADMLARFRTLLLRGADVMAVADDPRNVDQLAEIAKQAQRTLPVIVEIDVGIGRTGCVEVVDAVALVKHIGKYPSLSYAGIQAYWGHLQQVMPFEERKSRVADMAMRFMKLDAGLGGRPPAVDRHRQRHRHALARLASRPFHRVSGRLVPVPRFLLRRGAGYARRQSILAVTVRGRERRHGEPAG